MEAKASIATILLCPSCGGKGRPVKPVTIESLVAEQARTRAGRTDGFRFCAQPCCDVVYYHPETGQQLHRHDVNVRVGQKETAAPRTVCYCFHHTVEEIEAEVKETGTSRILDSITEKCRQGLDRCEETNPQGACCLGNVRSALKGAQAGLGPSAQVDAKLAWQSKGSEGDCCAMNTKRESTAVRRLDAGIIAQVGALASAVVASACCWLPLLLIAVGVSGGTLAATFEAWRPVLLPVTFALLGVAYYFTYRKPRVARSSRSGSVASDETCCAVPQAGDVEACCLPGNAKAMTLSKVNKAMLWVVTTLVLAFAFFPNYVGYLLGDGEVLAVRDDLNKVVVDIEGMTCEACAASIQDSLRKVPGVVAADVSYEKRQAIIGVRQGSVPPREAIISAIAGAGSYRGSFPDKAVPPSAGRVAAKLIVLQAVDATDEDIQKIATALSSMKDVFHAGVLASEQRCVFVLATVESAVTVERAVRYLDLAGYTVKEASDEVQARAESALHSTTIGVPASAAGSCDSPGPAPTSQQAGRLTSLADSVEPLRDAFNAAKGRYRFVALLSPT